MARFTAVVDSPRSIEDVFAYLADFSTTEEWDPGTVRAERLDDGPVALGSRFRLTVAFAGRELELVYEITEFEAPNRVVLLGENATTRSHDTITFDEVGDRTRISYVADLTLKGLLKAGQPLLALTFPKIGREAVEGLRQAVGGEMVHSD